MISLSMAELSINQSFVKQPFKVFEEMDRVNNFGKFRRSTTCMQDLGENEAEYLDFYDEIEHLIRQENI